MRLPDWPPHWDLWAAYGFAFLALAVGPLLLVERPASDPLVWAGFACMLLGVAGVFYFTRPRTPPEETDE